MDNYLCDYLCGPIIFVITIIKTHGSESRGQVECVTTVSYLHKRTILIERSQKPAIIHQPTIKIAQQYKTAFDDLLYKYSIK